MTGNSLSSLKPIERVPLTEAVAQRILSFIKEGQLTVGDKLPSQKELGDMLKVSRPSLREVLSGLIMMGYIEARAGQGYFLRKIPTNLRIDLSSLAEINEENQIRSLYQARELIEPIITELATKNATHDEIQKMFACVRETELHLPSEESINIGNEFHQLVADATHNPVLAQIESVLLKVYSEIVPLVLTEPPSYEHDVATHLKIAQCIEARDSDGARRAALGHIREFEKEIDVDGL